MRTISNPICWILLALAGAGAGCQSSMEPPAGRNDPLKPGEYPNIVVLDDLRDFLGFEVPIVQAAADGKPMQVTVPVRLMWDNRIAVQYEFQFLDRKGRPVDKGNGWRLLAMPPRTQQFMEASALSSEAADWRLQVRSAK